MKTLWKAFKKDLKSNNGNIKWKIGEWQCHKGDLIMCQSGLHASEKVLDSMSYTNLEELALVEVKGNHLEQEDKQCWEYMRIVKLYEWNKKDSVALAIFASELVLENYEKEYPNDKRPREAIEAAKKVLKKDTSAARSAARSAESAAWSAESAAESAARSAAESAARSAAESAAWSAAWSAAESAARSAAESAARSAESAAESAAWSAAWSAARSAESAAWSAESAAWSAARSAESAAWSAESAAWSAAESAAKEDIINKCESFIQERIKILKELK